MGDEFLGCIRCGYDYRLAGEVGIRVRWFVDQLLAVQMNEPIIVVFFVSDSQHSLMELPVISTVRFRVSLYCSLNPTTMRPLLQ